MRNSEPRFYCCEECGKKLIERKENGLWYFVFGKARGDDGKLVGKAPVEMWIHGSLKMKCLKRSCQHINVLNFFPFAKDKMLDQDGDL